MSEQALRTNEARLDFETAADYEESDDVIETNQLSDIETQIRDALDYEDPIDAELSENRKLVPEAVNETEPEAPVEPPASKYDAAELEKFQEMFKSVFGLEPDVVKAQLETQQTKAVQEKLSNDLNSLQSEWQVDVTELNTRLDLVSQHLSTMSPELQKSLDNPEGIRLIWKSISGDASRKVPPRFERNSAPAVRTKPKITWADIEAMDNATYERNAGAIQELINKGLV